MSHVNLHADLIDQLGGCQALAERLDVNPTTVWRWQRRGIPADYWLPILTMCRRRGIEMSADQLLRSSPEFRPSRRSAQLASVS